MARWYCLALALGLGGALFGVERVGEAAATATAAPVQTTAAADDWHSRLPQSATVVVHDGVVGWQDAAGHRFAIVGVAPDGQPLIDTAIGRLPAARPLIAGGRAEAVGELADVIAQAVAAKLDAAGFTVAEGVITGVHLRSRETLVLAEGVLRKTAVPAPDGHERKQLAAAAARVRAGLAAYGLGDLARGTVEHLLERLGEDDSGPEQDEEIQPSFARRAVRCGCLRTLAAADPEAAAAEQALEQAVIAAEAFAPTTLFTGEGLRLAELRNLFGVGGWTLATPKRCRLVHVHDPLRCHPGAPELNLALDLPLGSDPLTSAAKATMARLLWGSQELARWTSADGFSADAARWREALPPVGAHIGDHVLHDFVPPHLTISEFNGDLVRLITAHGVVAAPLPDSPASARTFLAEAAKALPDAAHLDLVGEHFFTYVFDSPDPAHPWLIANQRIHGDIHQTSEQTLSATTGGMFRGDCDDLAELYRDLAALQGRLSYVIHLPSHAAAAWAEKADASAAGPASWTTYVLQTGQPLEFTAATLPDSLVAAYQHFERGRSLNPDQVSLALRFDGENTRSTWVLSWRIFAERTYADTMVDVERDWYFHTYNRGIVKMQKLLDSGDRDPANYEELSGLYRRTAQWQRSVEFKAKSLASTDQPLARLEYAIEQIGLLTADERWDEATAAGEDALKLMQGLAKQLGDRLPRSALTLAAVLDEEHHRELRQRVLDQLVMPTLLRQTAGVKRWIGEKFDQRAWNYDPFLRQFDTLSGSVAMSTMAILRKRGLDHLIDDKLLNAWARYDEDWLEHIAFVPDQDPSAVLNVYASAAYYYATLLGHDRLRELIDAAPMPEDAKHDHAKRLAGLAQLRLDLPWIKCSAPYWYAELGAELWKQKPESFDPAPVLRQLPPLEAAFARDQQLGLLSPHLEQSLREARLIAALIGRKPDELRQLLAEIRKRNDRRTYEECATTIGSLARLLPKDWFAQVLDCWKTTVDIKPFYFAIAWQAVVSKADDQALMAAKLASERFADDPAFAEEYRFMQGVIAERKAGKKAEPAEKAKEPPVAP